MYRGPSWGAHCFGLPVGIQQGFKTNLEPLWYAKCSACSIILLLNAILTYLKLGF